MNVDNNLSQYNDNNNLCLPESHGGNFFSVNINKKPHICPVCSGKGIVPNGFYSSTRNIWIITTTVPEKCRSCDGTGVVWG